MADAGSICTYSIFSFRSSSFLSGLLFSQEGLQSDFCDIKLWADAAAALRFEGQKLYFTAVFLPSFCLLFWSKIRPVNDLRALDIFQYSDLRAFYNLAACLPHAAADA